MPPKIDFQYEAVHVTAQSPRQASVRTPLASIQIAAADVVTWPRAGTGWSPRLYSRLRTTHVAGGETLALSHRVARDKVADVTSNARDYFNKSGRNLLALDC